MKNPKILILYTELADYSLACFRALKQDGVELWLVHWPVNAEAPFKFDLSFCDRHLSRKDLNVNHLRQEIEAFQPHLILCSGWIDKTYVAICRSWFGKIPTVLTLDNHWRGTAKQQLARLLSPISLRRTFSHAFVPGRPQKDYALKLGFPEERISLGFYSADTYRFLVYYKNIMEQKSGAFPKRFLFVGRYVRHKGIFELFTAFIEFRKTHTEWELWCAGTGAEFEHRVESEGIRHFGFVQPSEMEPILSETGVYILPSHFEPWGVSVHEMAVAGFPMLLSDEVGAKEAFMTEGKNGKTFKSGNAQQLFDAMCWISEQTDEKLLEMGRLSHELGMKNTPEIWASTLLSILK